MPAPDRLVEEGPVCRARLYPERGNRYVDALHQNWAVCEVESNKVESN